MYSVQFDLCALLHMAERQRHSADKNNNAAEWRDVWRCTELMISATCRRRRELQHRRMSFGNTTCYDTAQRCAGMYPRIDICGYPQIFTDTDTDCVLWSVKIRRVGQLAIASTVAKSGNDADNRSGRIMRGPKGAWPPWKTGWPPRNSWFERVQGGLKKAPLKSPVRFNTWLINHAQFLADRTNGRAIATLLRQSSSSSVVCRRL